MFSEKLFFVFSLLPALEGVEARASNGSGDHSPIAWIVKAAEPPPVVVRTLNDGNPALVGV